MANNFVNKAAKLWASDQFASYLNLYCALPTWDLSQATSLHTAFLDLAQFDADLSRWVVSGVTSLYATFARAASFRGVGVELWDVARVTTFEYLFQAATLFDADLGSWDTSSAVDLSYTFAGAVSFRGTGVSSWAVSRVAAFACVFQGARIFDADLSAWDTSRAVDLAGAFFHATSFRGMGLARWNVAKVTSFSGAFKDATVFDANVTTWDARSAVDLSFAFNGASAFRGAGVSSMNVAAVTTLESTFQGAIIFDADLTAWVTGSATDLSSTFSGAVAFQGTGVSRWDVASVTVYTATFKDARVFDADLSGWDTSSAVGLIGTFRGAASFHGKGVHRWDVARATTFEETFASAKLFDADLTSWDTSSATDLT